MCDYVPDRQLEIDELSSLRLSKLELVCEYSEGSRPGRESLWQDFFVDGKRLSSRLFNSQRWENRDRKKNSVQHKIAMYGFGCLGHSPGSEGYEQEMRRMLMGEVSQEEREMSSGWPFPRVPLYVCTECGDPDCGTVDAEIYRVEDYIIWQRFEYNNWQLTSTWEGKTPEDETVESYKGVGPFKFNFEEYRETVSKYKGMPAKFGNKF